MIQDHALVHDALGMHPLGACMQAWYCTQALYIKHACMMRSSRREMSELHVCMLKIFMRANNITQSG